MKSSEIDARVRQGLAYQREGDLESAGRVYGEILSVDGQRADALHLFGVVLHQLGDHPSAIKAISRAIALRPNLGHFHANLAEVYRSVGRHDRARGCLILACKLRPDRFADRTQFDLLLWREGQFDHLALPLRPTAEPATPEAVEHTRIGLQLWAEGDRTAAFDHFVEAVRQSPGSGLSHGNLGQVLLESRRLDEALFHSNEAVRLAPEHPEPWNHLGNVLRALGRSIEARSCYLEALRIAPDLAVAQNNLGRDLLASACPLEALAWFRMALETDPGSVAIRSNVATALKESGQLDEAAAFAEATVSLAPKSAESHLILGTILHESRRFDEAVQAFRAAIQLNPSFRDAQESLGILLTEMGNLEPAERALREVLRQPGDPTRALVGLTNIHRGRLPEADLAAIHRLLADPKLPGILRAELHFAAAIVADGRKNYPQSADHLRRANAIRHDHNFQSGQAYQPEDHDEFIDQTIEVCSAGFFERTAGFGLRSARPVFIFGLPRSGTSLTEQILASHSSVHGLGETELVRQTFESLPALIGSNLDEVASLGQIDRQSSIELARSHLDRLDAIDRRAMLMVDKMPNNYLYLGFLATIFPQARFIHCRRDLRDTAVSCWSTNFWTLRWTNHIDHIVSRFMSYQRLMSHWENVLPIPILHVDYEQTVDDLETTARTLLDWCGLAWEPACLTFHEAKRVVRTASVTQVRQPIYRKSVERWRNYEAELGPLFERLEVEIKV